MTETRTFDGATPSHQVVDEVADFSAPEKEILSPISALERLQREVEEKEAEEAELFPVEIPGLDWRLMCSLDFSSGQWESWQRAAIPKNKRRRPSPVDLQQGVLCKLVLVNTCESLEYKDSNGEWQVLPGRDGDPLTLASDELLTRFNQMDPESLLAKLFGKRDAHILRAGQAVINAAGFGDPEEELGATEDPTL
jgi:hypothetical protein